ARAYIIRLPPPSTAATRSPGCAATGLSARPGSSFRKLVQKLLRQSAPLMRTRSPLLSAADAGERDGLIEALEGSGTDGVDRPLGGVEGIGNRHGGEDLIWFRLPDHAGREVDDGPEVVAASRVDITERETCPSAAEPGVGTDPFDERERDLG